jgi:response regulator RpfG family c-di-GMP phosphodiesterase
MNPSPVPLAAATSVSVSIRSSPPGSPASVLEELLASALILAEDWEALPAPTRDYLARCPDAVVLLSLLVQYGLLTEYQAQQVGTGQSHGLVLNNYRVLDRLGLGTLGVVYKAEHIHLRRLVAIKVFTLDASPAPEALQDFYHQTRAVTRLRHPNLVEVHDLGRMAGPYPQSAPQYYLVMEYVAGWDLQSWVANQGPLAPELACHVIYQLASALAEAHPLQLVHGDIKPSNVRVTPEGQAKLLDFGLARRFRPGRKIDETGPEPGDAADPRTDIYGLGGTLFWCLTGEALNRWPALADGPRLAPARTGHPLVAPELDEVVARLTAPSPDDRPPTPHAVMSALLPFLGRGLKRMESGGWKLVGEGLLPMQSLISPTAEAVGRTYHVLIADDELDIRSLCRFILEPHGICCEEAADGEQALRMVGTQRYDLVLLDMAMPGMTGQEVCRKLRENPPTANLKIVLFSGHLGSDDLAHLLSVGADDYVTKPFSIVQLLARIKAALRLKDAQDRADQLNHQLLGTNRQLEQNLHERDRDLVHAHQALILALAKLVECRDTETGTHIKRLQSYCRVLAEEAARLPALADQIDEDFIRWLEWCAPLHDIGKAGIPDRILQKEGLLTPEERAIMQTHTILGANTLKEVARQHGSGMAFLQMAIDVARHHHERYDGAGYPDQLAGNDIPLAARLLAIADVYDALRSRRVYKPALSHAAAMQMMLEASPGQFDPALLGAFQRCGAEFDRIFTEWCD